MPGGSIRPRANTTSTGGQAADADGIMWVVSGGHDQQGAGDERNDHPGDEMATDHRSRC